MSRPTIKVVGQHVEIDWPHATCVYLTPDEATQLVSDSRVINAIRHAVIGIRGAGPALPIDGAVPISEEPHEAQPVQGRR